MMPPVLKDLLTSKKFIVMVAALVVAIASKLGLDLDKDLVNQVLAMAAAYVVGQGIADHGKEAAKVFTASSASPPVKLPTAAAPEQEAP